MTNGGATQTGNGETRRAVGSNSVLATRIFETLGLLNKGSAAISTGDAGKEATERTPITPPALNVTRVAAVVAAIASAGAVALGLFNVDKTIDDPGTVSAAYISTVFIVAAALIAVAPGGQAMT